MTLDESIKHCEEKAKELRSEAEYLQKPNLIFDANRKADNCLECANEHEQLAEWLNELKALREFTQFVAKEVVDDNFNEDADSFAEVICRKLTKLGYVELKDDTYYVKEGITNE